MAGYSRGSSANIIVGAAALFVGSSANPTFAENAYPTAVTGQSYKDTLQNNAAGVSPAVRNIGYTNNGIELTFTPTFGDVTVDQLLDVAKLYKSGMQVTLKTSFAEATLENLLVAIGQKGSVLNSTATGSTWTETQIGNPTGTSGTATTAATAAAGTYIDITSGDLGDYPVERSIIAVGPGPTTNLTGANVQGSTSVTDQRERVYVAYRAVSITNVTVAAKRDAATMFDVEFRLLPLDSGVYGKIVDRTF